MRSKSLVKKTKAWHASVCSFALMLALGSAALWGQQVQQEAPPPVQPQAEPSPATPSQAPPSAAQSDSERRPGTPPKAQRQKSPLDELDDLEPPAKASPPPEPTETESLRVLLGRPLVVTSPATITRFSVADPNIVDLVVLNNNEILVIGKQRGRVSLVVADATGQSQQFDINVECEPPAMPDQLLAAISGQPAPGEAPEHSRTWIYWVVVGSILLAGGTILGARRRRRPSFSNLGLQALSISAAGTTQGGAAIAEPHESPAVHDSDADNTTDRLAGLQACGRFLEAVGEECRVSARLGRTLSVVLVDLDGFEPTSDRDSQSESKQILTVVAKLLEARSRQPNLVASYGRGKFALLLPQTNTQQAEILAERIRTSVETNAVLRARAVTASIGIATYPDHGGVSEEILKLADSGVQLAKRYKGNCVKVLPPVPKPGNAERNERLLEKYFDLEAKATPHTAHGPEPGDSRDASTTAPNQSSLLDTITALAFAVDAKGPYTAGHSQVVSRLAARIAIQVGLSVAEVEETRLAGLVHDIGKIQVPESVCNKPDQLTTEEFEVMSRHSSWGAKILEPLNVKSIESIVRHHHERFDGKGYPDRLAADKIPLGARIVAVAESFHSMLSDLPYKSAKSFEDALAELRRCSGMQFDPEIVMAFLDWIQSYAASPERQKA
jgi:diguanylate cyclase (GGDEF)-like protein/putative nucleotidyltransferase with HDIG domain